MLAVLDNLHCSLINICQPTTLHSHGTGCSSPKTSESQSEKGPVSLSVCACVLPCAMVSEGLSCIVWKHVDSAEQRAKERVSMTRCYPEQQSFPSCCYLLLNLPLQACISDFWVGETITATWEWISTQRCKQGRHPSHIPLLWPWHGCPSMVHSGLGTCEYMAANTCQSGRRHMFVDLSDSWQNSKYKWSLKVLAHLVLPQWCVSAWQASPAIDQLLAEIVSYLSKCHQAPCLFNVQ